MIPIPKTGKMKKLDQANFREEGWQLVTSNQPIKSVLKTIGVRNDDYRSLYILRGVDQTLFQSFGSTFMLEVWAGWHQEPSQGSAFVCLYDRGKVYPD
ncbi:MAG: hypothetical protein WA919_04340 [Coleofasciculaceae cyanobacterium]